MSIWTKLLGAPVELAAKAYTARLERKIREAELEDAKHARRLKVIEQGRVNEATWNLKAIENSGWRDEWITVLLSIPLVLVFGPDSVQAQIAEGFEVLSTLPDWYKGGVGLMIGSAFGYQKFHQYAMNKAYVFPEDNSTNG